MGYELEGELVPAPTEDFVRRLFDSLLADGRWQSIRRGPSQLALAYTGQKVHPRWPERIEVHVDGARLYVVFHVDSGAQRDEFLSAVEAIVESMGRSYRLDEL